jgi:hypothetical protein
MRVFLAGNPGEMGGANTEAWHTVKLWRRAGLDVHLIPTWGFDDRWRARLDALGCVTHPTRPDDLERVPGLAGSPVVAFCNGEFLTHAHRFRALGCPLVWANCMTFLFDHEKKAFADHGPADAFVFQSEFQRKQLEPQLVPLGYNKATGHLIRGPFDLDEWEFRPRPHGKHEAFVVGRVTRPDADKWSSNTWRIYDRIAYRHRQALVMGVDERTLAKPGPPPPWASILRPMAIPTPQFFATLHCLLPITRSASRGGCRTARCSEPGDTTMSPRGATTSTSPILASTFSRLRRPPPPAAGASPGSGRSWPRCGIRALPYTAAATRGPGRSST